MIARAARCRRFSSTSKRASRPVRRAAADERRIPMPRPAPVRALTQVLAKPREISWSRPVRVVPLDRVGHLVKRRESVVHRSIMKLPMRSRPASSILGATSTRTSALATFSSGCSPIAASDETPPSEAPTSAGGCSNVGRSRGRRLRTRQGCSHHRRPSRSHRDRAGRPNACQPVAARRSASYPRSGTSVPRRAARRPAAHRANRQRRRRDDFRRDLRTSRSWARWKSRSYDGACRGAHSHAMTVISTGRERLSSKARLEVYAGQRVTWMLGSPVGTNACGSGFSAKRSAIQPVMSFADGAMTPAWVWPG